MVAKGYSQVPGQDFEFTFSSVACLTTLQVLLALAVCENWEIYQVNIVGAYLQGNLDEEIYMNLPQGATIDKDLGKLWCLRRPPYGLKQAGRQWKIKLDGAMRMLGFTSRPTNAFTQSATAESWMWHCWCMWTTWWSFCLVLQFKVMLGNMFRISNLGELKHILGI